MPAGRLALILALLVALPAAGALAGLPDAPRTLRLAISEDATRPMASAPTPVSAGGIGPGTLLLVTIDGATFGCSANWIWTGGGATYLGAAGHCFLPDTATATHGRGADHVASGTHVRACVVGCAWGGQSAFLLTGETVALGPVAYARQSAEGAQVGNDFGLVRVPDHLLHFVRTDVPVWGHASATRDLAPGDLACYYGNAAAFGESYATKARTGAGILTLPDGSWRFAGASAPGDSGGAVASCIADANGVRAAGASGILTHLAGGLIAGTTMAKAQHMAREAGLVVTPELD